MQFSKLILAASAFVAANAVQFTNPTFAGITAGVPFEIMWSGASGPVTLILKNGPALDLKDVSVISQGLTGTSFTWTPPATLAADTYAITITDTTGVPNYSTQFQLVGGAPLSASSSLASASLASASSSASSSAASSLSSALSSLTSQLSSVSSSISSASSVASTSSAAFSAFSASSAASRTSTASTASRTNASASGSPAAAITTLAPSSGAAGVASPLAMVFLALAAFMTIN